MTDRRGIAWQLHFASGRQEVDFHADYRYMATEIRDLIPLILHPQAVADLRLLADRYERLARYLEVAPGKLPATPIAFSRQAS